MQLPDAQKEKFQQQQNCSFNQLLMQLVILTKSFIVALDRLLNDVETLKAIQVLENDQSQRNLSFSDSSNPNLDELGVSIWDDILNERVKDTNDLSLSTLNELVYKLTSETNYDNTFLQTFITTYQSFSTPTTLFEKLKERYAVPNSFIELQKPSDNDARKKKIFAVQLRVIIALKYWLETQFIDFDTDLISQLYLFIEETIKRDGHCDMANSLKRILDTKLEEREQITMLMLSVPTKVDVPESGTSPLDLFLDADPSMIAQQLTMIECSIYQRIEITELLNQSWNKAKLKHRSPNVLALISRATKVSMWLATTVLLAEKTQQRLKIFEKMIDIANQLFNLNNFNTLMSIIAGLNLTPIHRLKKTTSKISNDRKKILEKLHQLMSPDAAYKNYRSALKSSSAPFLPYLGIGLTDITFSEDGNSDMIDGKINFKKREMIYKIIREILQPQNAAYNFRIVEPLHTFLVDLPYISDTEELYDISIFYEPREEKKKRK